PTLAHHGTIARTVVAAPCLDSFPLLCWATDVTAARPVARTFSPCRSVPVPRRPSFRQRNLVPASSACARAGLFLLLLPGAHADAEVYRGPGPARSQHRVPARAERPLPAGARPAARAGPQPSPAGPLPPRGGAARRGRRQPRGSDPGPRTTGGGVPQPGRLPG